MDDSNQSCEKCIQGEENKMDILFRVMDKENDVTLTDGKGMVLRVSDSYEEHYGVMKNEIVGKSVFELERQGIFKPSITAIVLKEKRKATIMQKNKAGHSILTTGVPIFDDAGNIEYVISFNSIDIAGMTTLQKKYDKLNELLQEYNSEINQLRMREINDRELITKSKLMTDIKELVLTIADTSANVLITGETGVGKSMIAKMLHQNSSRVDEPFIEINCGTIPASLIESELFGYERGAFTGANTKGKLGKIELANRGTLFLDEIGELPNNIQIKLLQVIQEKVIMRIGGLSKIDVDFRLIAATNRDLKKDIKENLFREDLYYRLNVIPLHIPPLRERPEDITPLVLSFLERFNKKYKKNISLAPEVFEVLEQQNWPGNIRQVENLVERLVVTQKRNLIKIQDMPDYIDVGSFRKNISLDGSLSEMTDAYEKVIFENAFKKYKTSVRVGKALGISQSTAARKLRKYLPGYAAMEDIE